MVHAKNYEIASTCVKVIQGKLSASFFRTRSIIHIHVGQNVSTFRQ